MVRLEGPDERLVLLDNFETADPGSGRKSSLLQYQHKKAVSTTTQESFNLNLITTLDYSFKQKDFSSNFTMIETSFCKS